MTKGPSIKYVTLTARVVSVSVTERYLRVFGDSYVRLKKNTYTHAHTHAYIQEHVSTVLAQASSRQSDTMTIRRLYLLCILQTCICIVDESRPRQFLRIVVQR